MIRAELQNMDDGNFVCWDDGNKMGIGLTLTGLRRCQVVFA